LEALEKMISFYFLEWLSPTFIQLINVSIVLCLSVGFGYLVAPGQYNG